MRVTSKIVLKDELATALDADWFVITRTPALTQEERAYRYGVFCTLLSLAKRYGLDVPGLEQAEAAHQEEASTPVLDDWGA